MSDATATASTAIDKRRLRREPVWIDGPATRRVSFGRLEIERLLEHRDPFLLVDGITAIDPVQGALEGTRVLDAADAVFRGHFPGQPIYPGCLQIEMIGQLALCCHHFQSTGGYDVPEGCRPKRYRGVEVHNAAFLAGLSPGDAVTIRARLLASDSLAMTCAGQLVKGGRICAVAMMEAYFVDGD
jgi:3-hydroxyacyl-[acyl-carrier-protein] dehydratase